MADEWHVVGFGKIKSNRKVICIRYVTKSQETRVSVLSIKSRASTSEGGEGHGGIIGALHILKGQPLPLSFSSLLLSPSLPHLSFLSQLSGFLSPQHPPQNPAGAALHREAIYKADVYCKVSHKLGASPNVIVIGGCV